MAFFRKWKTHYRHKKFTSDEIMESEDWNSVKEIDIKMDVKSIDADDEDEEKLFATYDIKYLGCTPIDIKRSEKVTSEAIKTVIANSKAGGRKNKTHKRVQLNVSKDCIEVLNQQTHESLMRFSIYEISYCSVDAAHDHTFSFVSSENDTPSGKEKMSCHVFQCPKRKVAHEITLMVARCFEHAYQHWREAVVQHAKNQGINSSDNVGGENVQMIKDRNSMGFDVGASVVESKAEVYQPQNGAVTCKSDNLLIDLAASDNEICKFLQNSWVSFDEEAREGIHILAC